MTDAASPSVQPGSTIPPDDPRRKLAVAQPDAAGMRRVSVAGDTYTILLTPGECGLDREHPGGRAGEAQEGGRHFAS